MKMIIQDASKTTVSTSKYKINEIVKVKLSKEEVVDEPCWLKRGLISGNEVVKHDFKIKGIVCKGPVSMYRIEKNGCIIDNVPEEKLEKSDTKVEHPRHIEQFIDKKETVETNELKYNSEKEIKEEDKEEVKEEQQSEQEVKPTPISVMTSFIGVENLKQEPDGNYTVTTASTENSTPTTVSNNISKESGLNDSVKNTKNKNDRHSKG